MSAADTAALVRAASIIARRAKEISSAFSRRIPASTHVTVSNGMVAVVTDGKTAPNAAPFEAAELHPLWARVGSYRYEHMPWGKQPLRAYMMTAATQKLDDAAQAYGEAVYAYARQRGFR
jgi:hypothetical protein